MPTLNRSAAPLFSGLPHVLVLGQPLAAWVEGGAIFLVLLLAVLFARRLLLGRLNRSRRQAARTPGEWDDVLLGLVQQTRWTLLALPALYLGSEALTLPPAGERALRSAAVLAFLLQVALWASAGIDTWVSGYRRRRLEVDAASATTVGVLRFLGKLTLWALLLLLALDNLGVNVTALVTGLGIGGVAVALALQNVLGDVFASLSIVLDKPFVLGDSIGVGDASGTVESIGLKTTRLRSATGEQLIFGNGELLKGRIRNFRRMENRTVTLGFTVAYGTPADRLEAVPGLLRSIVQAQPQVRFDRAHLKGFGAAGFDFEASYTVLTPDFNFYMDRQQAIDLALVRALAEHEVELARPDRLLLVERPAEGA
ncbi:MAG TPA: mechanosensitive ion channel family protein [Thermoanaerobaculia bacterium]|nr:mechanosensitive ion channel family protein [Thermoanaerobaculia bacterium]